MHPLILTLAAVSSAGHWVQLFDGETAFGWNRQPEEAWSFSADGMAATPGRPGRLEHRTVFGDFLLSFEFRATPDAKGAVVTRAGSGEKADSACSFHTKGASAGPDGWAAVEIEAVGDRCEVRLNGRRRGGGKARARTGRIVLEYGARGALAFRNVRLKPLGLRPLFNGTDLDGWRIVTSPNVQYGVAAWSVREGEIHVDPGQGALESTGLFGDFVLQLGVRTRPRKPGDHPNSGVFVRGAPGVFWSGYETQIRNTAADRYGTGGLYNIQRARKIVAGDDEWFTLTIAAFRRHIAIWVNGVPVNDWDDPNPEGGSVREKLAMLKPGAIALQAHDPQSPSSFRAIGIAALEPE